MKVFIIACLIFLVAFLCMSVGLIFGKARLRGSCCGDSGHSHHEQDKERCIGCPTSSDECMRDSSADRSCEGMTAGSRTEGNR